MPSSFSQDFEDGLAEIEQDYQAADGSPLALTWSGKAYPCSAGPGTTTKDLGVGGFGTAADRIVPLRRSLFGLGPVPALKQTCQIEGKTYRINEITLPPGQPFMLLALIDPTKGS